MNENTKNVNTVPNLSEIETVPLCKNRSIRPSKFQDKY